MSVTAHTEFAVSRLWRITQGMARALVVAPDYPRAVERAAQIGFKKPDSVVLIREASKW